MINLLSVIPLSNHFPQDSPGVYATPSSSMSAAAEKVKDVAVDEVKRIEKLTNDAARSGAYFYPIRVRPQLRSHLYRMSNADTG